MSDEDESRDRDDRRALLSLRRVLGAAAVVVGRPRSAAGARSIVVETAKGTFEFETYPAEAPKTVAHIVELVKRGFYNGLRVHRALPGFVVQLGDPQSRDCAREADWGRGRRRRAATPIGVAEMHEEAAHTSGAVAMAHPGDAGAGRQPDLRHAGGSRPTSTASTPCSARSSPARTCRRGCERGDQIVKMYVKE